MIAPGTKLIVREGDVMRNIEIADQLTLRLPALRPRKRTSPVLAWVREREQAFWLQLCCMVLIVAVECSGLVFYLASRNIALPSFDAPVKPTMTTYPCAHVTLFAHGGHLQAVTDYTCP